MNAGGGVGALTEILILNFREREKVIWKRETLCLLLHIWDASSIVTEVSLEGLSEVFVRISIFFCH